MKINKLSFAIAIITVAISILGFLIIYNDMNAVPEYDKYFVFNEGVMVHEV